MPVLNLTNNGLLPANQRASDVASFAVEGIVPVQQQRINAAFRVQGVQAVIYHRINQGKKCTCQSHGKSLNTRLNTSGNADPALINELLTGKRFGTSRYTPQPQNDTFGIVYTPLNGEPTSADLPRLWNDVTNPTHQEEVGDNGVSNIDSLEDMYNGFDESALTFGDTNCPVCFGTGYVGGYVVYNGCRTVVPCNDMDLGSGILNFQDYPNSCDSLTFSFPLVLPKGVVSIDCFRLRNTWDTVNCALYIDDIPVTTAVVKAKCDGGIHKVSGKFNTITKFTHFEFQANLSTKSAYVEFPKLAKSSRLDILDSTDNFQLLLSPDIPTIEKRDIICDCMHNKCLYVQDTTWLNTRQRQMLGWELNVRVVQPQESVFNLPRRKPVRTRNQTVNPVIGNITNRP